MIIIRLALKSIRNRWLTALLTVLSIAFSVTLLLGVEQLRTGARQSFADTISGTDLIAGARSGNIQLLLYSVFRIGNATNNMTWQSYEDIAARPEVAWIVPLSLGDSHRGFRVLGTNNDYFKHYRYRRTNTLVFAQGRPFAGLYDAVIGADVAKALDYKVDQSIVIAHGLGSVSFVEHNDKPFRVAGILAKTGTPVDRTVHVSLEAIEAIHLNWNGGAAAPNGRQPAKIDPAQLKPKAITAALIGLKSKLATFRLQRAINNYRAEPLSAVLPGAALFELWELIGTAETALSAVSVMVVITALIGMVTMILTTLNERRRELAILRSLGARPSTILGLLTAEAAALTLAGVLLGTALLYAALLILRPWLDAQYGLYLGIDLPRHRELLTLGAIIMCGILAGFLPALRAYRLSLADGMMIKT